MIYKEFQSEKISALAFGTMRLPVKQGVYADIDMAAAGEMVDYAMQNGVNYYDTAWGYHDGQSEIAIGKLLSGYRRESYYLASKFPGYDLRNMDKAEEIFETQCKKCGVEYFDFYLFHNVCEMNIDDYLDERHGVFAYLKKQKECGRIKHLGFSAHGSIDVIRRFLEKYGAYMEFGQLQVNYIDWSFQNAKSKVALLKSYGIPVWVMEPVRGGKLASLAPEDEKTLRSLRPDESIPAWAFRFLQGIPEVTTILSGMSDMAQVQDNIRTFAAEKPLRDAEKEALFTVVDKMLGRTKLPCTACRYCTSHCPRGLDIPALVDLYNEHRFTGGGFIAPMVVGTLAAEKRPNACIGCRSCEKVCPQQLKISEMMRDFAERLKKEK